MQERVQALLDKAMDAWRALEKKQKIRLSLVAAVFLVALGLTVFLATRPKMALILRNEDYATIGQAQNALNEAGIKSYPVNRSTGLEVNEKDVVQAKYALNSSGVTERSGFTFADVLEKTTLGTSDRVTKTMLQRSLQTDIEEVLIMFDNVNEARVLLTVPNDTVYFWEAQQVATASVFLETSGRISDKQAQNMARFVVSSVPGLDLERVEITDQDGNTVFSGTESTEVSLATTKSELEIAKRNELNALIKSSLKPLFNDVFPNVNLVFNHDQESRKTITYSTSVEDSDAGLVTSRKTEQSSATGGTTAADPGTGENDNVAPTYPNGTDNQSATHRASEELYALNEDIREYVSGTVGDLVHDRSSISVIVYTYKYYDQKAVRQRGLTSREKSWDEFIEENNIKRPLDIDENLVNALKSGTGIENLTVTGYEVPVFVDEEVEPIQVQQIIILVICAILILLLAYALIRKSQPDEITEIEPELSVEDLLVSTQLEEEDSEVERLRALEIKESETKRQIERFVAEKPEAVAQLLRNWLNEEWE